MLSAIPSSSSTIVSPTSIQMRGCCLDQALRHIESTTTDVTVMERKDASVGWFTSMLTVIDVVKIPEVGIEVSVADIYEGVIFAAGEKAVIGN